MKRIMIIIGLVSFTYGCNSGDKKKDETKTDTEVGVQNVNGNIPDTTNAINLKTQRKDSGKTGMDSAK